MSDIRYRFGSPEYLRELRDLGIRLHGQTIDTGRVHGPRELMTAVPGTAEILGGNFKRARALLRCYRARPAGARTVPICSDVEHGPCAERVTVLGDHHHRGRLVWCTPNGAVSLVLMVGYWGPGRLRMIPSHRTRLGW